MSSFIGKSHNSTFIHFCNPQFHKCIALQSHLFHPLTHIAVMTDYAITFSTLSVYQTASASVAILCAMGRPTALTTLMNLPAEGAVVPLTPSVVPAVTASPVGVCAMGEKIAKMVPMKPNATAVNKGRKEMQNI